MVASCWFFLWDFFNYFLFYPVESAFITEKPHILFFLKLCNDFYWIHQGYSILSNLPDFQRQEGFHGHQGMTSDSVAFKNIVLISI